MVTPESGRPDEPEPEDREGLRNTLSGPAGGVVQAGAVHGDVHLHAPPPRASVVPRQLPAARELFTGRVTELAVLDRTLSTTSPDGHAGASAVAGRTVVISAIGGAGGIGKTWLALGWANRHVDRFPDGQLFVDLCGFSPAGEPMAPGHAVRGFLTALGMAPDGLPAEVDAQAALYRSLIADKRMLIVLDNAATVEQVAPLLPGGRSCTVLVTSRNRLPGLVARHGARPLSLDVLTDAEARALLVAWLGAPRVAADQGAVTELVGLCGGFPLALGVIAARARTRPRVPLSDIAAELRESGLDALDSDDPTASLPAVLSWSLHHLTTGQRQVFALLGIAPGPDIGLPAAASLTGLPPAQARNALRTLEDASLIDRRPHGRYAMHDLIRAYAATAHHDLDGTVRRAALERVVDFYLHTAHTAGRLLTSQSQPLRLDPPAPGVRPLPLPDLAAALAWLDTEHLHLLAAQHTAATHHRHHTVLHLAWAVTTFHTRRGHRHDDLAVWQAALDAAGHLPDPAPRMLAHRLLGRALSRLRRHDQAAGHLREALALAEQHHDLTEQAHIHRALARARGRRGEDQQALEHARRALGLYRTLEQPMWEAVALSTVSWYAARLGDYDTAREHCRVALTLHRRHDNPDGEAATLDSLGLIDHHTGHHHEAIHHYRQALALFRTLGYTTDAANILDRLGHPLAVLDQRDRAREAWQEALELYREQGRDTDAQRVQRQLDDLDTEPDTR
ncbi:ATP-binding protein [Actinosynnema sp. CS-041913]|uniref:ATP-binding protein n=1 Tax=Actinosynnema sp. CS-041913 TaxID=3239917 RepID=UPI003D8AABA2